MPNLNKGVYLKKLLLCVAILGSVSLAQAADAPATAPTTKPAEDLSKVIIRVGDDVMTIGDYNNLIDSLPEQVRAMAKGPGRRGLAEKVVEVSLLSAEAKRMGLDKDPKVQMQLELARKQILTQALAEKVQSDSDEASLKKYYEEHKSDFEKVKARHILIRTAGSRMPLAPGKTELTDEQAKEKALAIRDRLVNKKEDFSAVAKAESDDLGSGAQGGDLGSFGHGRMVPPFEKAAFAAKIGEVTEPVKSEFGYHLILVDERQIPAFDAVKEEIGPKKFDDLVKKLKETQKVEIDDAFFGTAAH